MNILYTTNDYYMPQVSASICSLLENNKHHKVTFYIFSDNIQEENKKILTEFVESYQQEIVFIELGDLSTYFTFEFDTLGWNKVILARLLMGRLLPKTVDKIIYLDGDTIIRGALDNLWNCDLGTATLAASPEPTVSSQRKADLGMNLTSSYVNSGVILVDLEKWRQNGSEQKIFDYYQKHNGKLFAADQDAINGALETEIAYLPPAFNFCSLHYYYPYKMLVKLSKPAIYLSETSYNEGKNQPIIVHYLGEDRPWRSWNNHPYKKDYERYLALSPWKDTPKEENWKLYFLFFNTFNILTRPFPMIRYKVIDTLIPTVMKIRAKKLNK